MQSRHLALAALAATGLAGAAAAPASAAPLDLGGQSTTLTLQSSTKKALTKLGVRVTPLTPSSTTSSGIRFGITSGRLDTATGFGTANHTGGLRLRAGGRSLLLRRFVTKTAASGSSLSAIVRGKRTTIITLGTSNADVEVSGTTLRVSGVTASLSGRGASALNSFFRVKAFKKGLRLGTLRTAAEPKAVIGIKGGTTSLAVDPNTATALAAAGVTPAPVAPATFSNGSFGFPIEAGGKVASTLATGLITHTGGISLSRGGVTIALQNFDIQLDATPSLSAQIGGQGNPLEVADVDLSKATVTPGAGTVTVSGAAVRLTANGANALNAVFGTNLPAGAPLGTATVSAQV